MAPCTSCDIKWRAQGYPEDGAIAREIVCGDKQSKRKPGWTCNKSDRNPWIDQRFRSCLVAKHVVEQEKGYIV